MLKSLINIFKEYFNNQKMGDEIPLFISENEILVRCIGHDLYYSREKGRILSTAFMPPPRSNEVSLLRLDYSNASLCKKHAKTIKKNDYVYIGLSITKAQSFLEATELCSVNEVIIEIVATPLDINKKLRLSKRVFVLDEGLPYHADLVYNWEAIKGKPAPNKIKKIAKHLSKNPPTLYFEDFKIDEIKWGGKPLLFD